MSLVTAPKSHHSRLPREEEQSEEREKARIDQQLDDEGDEQEPIKKTRSPDPVANHTQHHEWLHDHENEIDRVRITEVVMMGQPPATDQKPINPSRAKQANY